MNLTDNLIEERQATHGNIQDNADRLFWLNKLIFVSECDVIADLSLRMLNLKLARFISSGFKVKDSIDDALGYLQVGGDIEPLPRVVRFTLPFTLMSLGMSQEDSTPIIVQTRAIIEALYNHDLDAVKDKLEFIQANAEEFNLV